MEVDVEVFVMLTMIIVLRARVLQGATCETHLNLNLAKPAETGTRYKQGNYSLRRPPKRIIPQAVIRH